MQISSTMAIQRKTTDLIFLVFLFIRLLIWLLSNVWTLICKVKKPVDIFMSTTLNWMKKKSLIVSAFYMTEPNWIF